MEDFQILKLSDRKVLEPYYVGKGRALCNQSVACKVMWGFNAKYLIKDGCLVIMNDTKWSGLSFDVPLPSNDDVNIDAGMEMIEDYCVNNGKKLVLTSVKKEDVAYLATRYNFYKCSNYRAWRDYIYDGEKMRTFVGKKYAGQRNHINKFISSYPTAFFRELTNNDREQVIEFLGEWGKIHLPNKSLEAKKEWKMNQEFLTQLDFNVYCTGCVELDGKIIALSIGEIVKETLIIHIEKALHDYEGVGAYMVREFAKAFPAKYINREDDSATRGLRISKLQYQPIEIADKYTFCVENELSMLKGVPTIKSERLVLNRLEEKDIKDYFRLCTDEKRNEFWGYDYKKDLTGELKEDYFYKVAKSDFKNKLCVNFAIRIDGKFIGETVLFNFNYRGECELGVRILPEYDGNGYGYEAFETTMQWALYGLGINRLKSSCYKENYPSIKMHEKLMKKIKEDDVKYYYERIC